MTSSTTDATTNQLAQKKAECLESLNISTDIAKTGMYTYYTRHDSYKHIMTKMKTLT